MPTSEASPIEQPWSIALWPIVQFRPIVRGKPASVWSTQFSWMFDPSPTVIGSVSPRRVEPNQTEVALASTTRPITCAPGAIQ